MIFDYENMFAEDLANTTVAAHVATNTINMEVAGDAIDELRFLCQITTTYTSGGAATGQWTLQSDVDSGFATSLVTHLDSGALALATLVAGYRPFNAVRLPSGMQIHQRVTLTIGTAVMTAGAYTAGYVQAIDTNTL